MGGDHVLIAAWIGCTPGTLRHCVPEQERDTGQQPGRLPQKGSLIKALERKVRELREANQILLSASGFFA
jgi:transposase